MMSIFINLVIEGALCVLSWHRTLQRLLFIGRINMVTTLYQHGYQLILTWKPLTYLHEYHLIQINLDHNYPSHK